MVKEESGQSTIEFLTSFIFIIAIMFLFLKIAFHYTNGYLVHYANYMASRSYLVIDNDSNNPSGSDSAAETKAEQVFQKYQVTSFIPGAPGLQQLEFNTPESDTNKVYTGTWVEYEQMFSITNLIGGKDPITFRSESFIGREPTRSTCLERICKAMKDIGADDCSDHEHITYYDNGC